MVEEDPGTMTYYDRYGVPLKLGDAVAALRGDDEVGYTAMIYVVRIPQGHHTPMLCSQLPCADIYQYIPSDAARLRLTNLGPRRNISLRIFEGWRSEVSQLPNVDSEAIKKLKYFIPTTYGNR